MSPEVFPVREPAAEKMKLSFCVTCMNRLHQLRQTLPENLDCIIKDGNSEIVVVNYNSADELDDWVRQFTPYMESGLLRYAHERTAQHFHASKAKNLAHFLATGDYVINLDGDNFIDSTMEPMREEWSKRPNASIWLWSGTYADGTFGRIGLPRDLFLRLGGYDEDFLPMAHQDRDLLMRANRLGSPLVHLHYAGARALVNSGREKQAFLGVNHSFDEMNQINRKISEEKLAARRFTVNEARIPVRLRLNFTQDVEA